MYKTVRKGDASLQYTILPQTDQFSLSGYPQAAEKPRPRIIKYLMAALMVLFILFSVATPFLMNQNEHNLKLFASTVFAMGRLDSQKSHMEPVRNRTRITVAPETTTEEAPSQKDLLDIVSSTQNTLRDVDQMQELTSADTSTSPTTVYPDPSTETSTKTRQAASTTLSSSTSSIESTTGTTMRITTSTEPTRSFLSSARKPKMPRVTLKLRENETIPQMYMKGGIATYKKGNITTSVVAHGLSLERLVFKTPEGTIKPWPQKLFLTDPSSDFQWKDPSSLDTMIPFAIYLALAGLVGLTMVSIFLTIYVQRKAWRRQRQNVEEPEAEGPEEDQSTLLGVESQEIEEKD